jgi:hypothetical protein
VYSTRIVSYSLSARMTAQLAVSAQRNVMRCAHQQER